VHVDFCGNPPGSAAADALGYYGSAVYNASLAAFLIGARNYSYYACSGHQPSQQGWGMDQGWDQYSADYDRPLGEPLGDATYSSKFGWHRRFALGTKVWLKGEWLKGDSPPVGAAGGGVDAGVAASKWGIPCIHWGDGHVTGAAGCGSR
jgi:hypothetical protein